MTMHMNAHRPLNDLHTAAGDTTASDQQQAPCEQIAASQSQEAQQDVDTRSCALLKTADSYLQGNPWKSSGAAASAGVLVGLLLARR